MTIKIAKNRELRVRCEARLPNDRDGYDKHMFYARLEAPDKAERQELAKQSEDNTLDMEAELRQRLRGWEKIHDEDGQELRFCDENVGPVLSDIYIFDALRRAFTMMIFNREDLRQKN